MRKKRKKPLKVTTERSQRPWGRSKQQAFYEEELRKREREIFALKEKLQQVAGSSDLHPITVHVPQGIFDVIDRVTDTRIAGTTIEETAATLLGDAARKYIGWV